MSNQTDVIMPVLGMSQDYGKLVHWIKQAGDWVNKGEPLMEVETDKATVEIEAPATGFLTQVSAEEGANIPVTQVIAIIQDSDTDLSENVLTSSPAAPLADPELSSPITPAAISISPLAARIAAEYQLDPAQIKPAGGRIEKADVINYLQKSAEAQNTMISKKERVLASPKARRLAVERGIQLSEINGTGPQGSIIANDVLSREKVRTIHTPGAVQAIQPSPLVSSQSPDTEIPLSSTWNRMVERISASWPTTPHFSLMKEVNASRLISWHQSVQNQTEIKITYTDLLVKLVAAALRKHPRINSHYQNGRLILGQEINIGLAVAVEDGLIVPVIHRADSLSINQIAESRTELVKRARCGQLQLEDLQNGTFTISNLGMYEIDAFNAIINPPQAAILAVGQIADRVIALNGQPAVQPMMVLNASFDHRVVDGVRGAIFLKTLADWIQEPLGIPNQ